MIVYVQKVLCEARRVISNRQEVPNRWLAKVPLYPTTPWDYLYNII